MESGIRASRLYCKFWTVLLRDGPEQNRSSQPSLAIFRSLCVGEQIAESIESIVSMVAMIGDPLLKHDQPGGIQQAGPDASNLG